MKKREIMSEEIKLKISLNKRGKMLGAENPSWKGGMLSIECRNCHSPLGRLAGNKHPRWIDDRSKVKIGDRVLNDPLQKQWCKGVKNRDTWKCRIADNNCDGKLEAHHILPWSKFPELRYQINNGITLCHFHHPRKMDDVIKLSPYFQELVASLE